MKKTAIQQFEKEGTISILCESKFIPEKLVVIHLSEKVSVCGTLFCKVHSVTSSKEATRIINSLDIISF